MIYECEVSLELAWPGHSGFGKKTLIKNVVKFMVLANFFIYSKILCQHQEYQMSIFGAVFFFKRATFYNKKHHKNMKSMSVNGLANIWKM